MVARTNKKALEWRHKGFRGISLSKEECMSKQSNITYKSFLLQKKFGSICILSENNLNTSVCVRIQYPLQSHWFDVKIDYRLNLEVLEVVLGWVLGFILDLTK